MNEFGNNVYEMHKVRLIDTYELSSTYEANSVIERMDGFDTWYHNTRKAKNLAKEAAFYIDSIIQVFTTWSNELKHVYTAAPYTSLIGKQNKTKKKEDPPPSSSSSSSSTTAAKKKKKRKARFWQNSTLQRGSQAIFYLLTKKKSDSIEYMSTNMREHLYLHFIQSRSNLKETFHRLDGVLKKR